MPRRTAEANKAIRLAWQREVELVREGKGTRDWTESQQRDILNPELGKAYDEDRKSFEGHHMKSAEAYPEHQGNPANIQFLSRTEHTHAHGGWQKPTNGYYDYKTGITYDFGNDDFSPCKVIELSNPVIAVDIPQVDVDVVPPKATRTEESSITAPPTIHTQQATVVSSHTSIPTKNVPMNHNSNGTVINGLMNAINVVKDFSDKHPRMTMIAEVGLGLATAVVTGKVIKTKIKTKPSVTPSNSLLNSQTIKVATEAAADVVSKFDFKKSESILKQLGYTVAKSIGLSDTNRQKILHDIISDGVMSKEAICAFLENNINLHKNQAKFTEAVGKWIEDLAYIRNG